jgi:hypothetical protein
MEEVRRVSTTSKPKRTTIILLTLVGLLGLGLIGAAIYFYAIGDSTKEDESTETTCACYYIDPAVVSECGDPRRGFLFETATVSKDTMCKAPCATSKLSVNLLNSSTQQDLYQICQLQVLQDKRCYEMTIKDGNGKIVTGKVSSTDQLSVEAKFEEEYTGHKFLINNQETEPDVISPDKLTIKKDITELDISTLSIVAVATDSTGEQINSAICRRLIEVEQSGTSNISSVQFEKRIVDNVYKISKVQIGIGNITNESKLTIRFSFDGKLADLLMNDGYTIDAEKGEVTILEQELYNTDNFGSAISFSQLDGQTGRIEVSVEVRDENGVIGSVEGSFDFPEIQAGAEEELTEESNFTVSKTSNLECVERVAPKNVAQFTLTSTSGSSIAQNITSIKDKLPLGFTYVENSSKINGVSVTDSEYVTVTQVGDTEEIVWQKENGWDVNAGQSLVIVFQTQAGANALTGSNQNEVIITPKEVPADPTTLRAEYVIQVAQDCENPDTPATETPTTPTTETPTTPSTGIFDSTLGRIVVGVLTILIGWYIYSRPLAQLALQKLVDSGVYKEIEIASWKIFRPKKYFEAKILKKIRKKNR